MDAVTFLQHFSVMQVNHFRILPRVEVIRIKASEVSYGHSKANSPLI